MAISNAMQVNTSTAVIKHTIIHDMTLKTVERMKINQMDLTAD